MSNFFTTDDDDDATLHPSSQSTRSTRHRQSNPIATLLDDAHHHPDQQSPLPTKNDTHKVSSAPPIIELQTAWVNERAAPQLLAWKGDAVDSVCSQIEEQMSIVESLAADASTAEEEHIRLSLVELDVERAKWLLRSYLRCRLDKIESHASFLVQDHSSKSRLSEMEKGYAIKYSQITSQHFSSSVLEFLPENMRSLSDKSASDSNGRGNMVTQPDLESPVFIRCLTDCGPFYSSGQESSIHFVKDSIHLVRYQSVVHLINADKAQLL